MGGEMTTQERINDNVALLVGKQAIEIIAMRAQIEALQEELEALKSKTGTG